VKLGKCHFGVSVDGNVFGPTPRCFLTVKDGGLHISRDHRVLIATVHILLPIHYYPLSTGGSSLVRRDHIICG
jgi:hypothetical protein